MKKSSLFPVFFVLFLDNFGFAVILATFGPLFNEPGYGMISALTSHTTSNIMLAVALAVFSFGQFFGSPFLGDIADRFGRKKAFYITITIATIGYILSGISIFMHSYFFLIFSRFLTGFFAGNLSICLASIADMSPDESSRAKNFSFIVIVTGISWMVAMLMGGYLSDPNISSHFNPALPFFITAVFSGLSLLAIAYMFKETHPSEEKFKLHLLQGFHNIINTLHHKELRVLYLVYFLWIFGWGLTFQWFSPYSIQVFKATILDITWGQFLFGTTWMIGGYFINNLLVKKFHARPIVIVGTGITSLLLLAMALSPNFYWFSGFMTVACFPAAFSWPNTLNLISMSASEDIQGKIMGISQSSMSVGFILATLFGGVLGAIEIKGIYFLAAILLFASWLVLSMRHLHLKKQSHSK
ncbi:MFS transporter [Simkania negevensis]|uniref:Tetracycline-efflux transporter n=1 Tax=Simkania negevensis (strain ATCC VR-1471 / DSM 27360 / Z) TaxID=331113 RepID=F8L7H0_SIMNZ|nr:MFS transporter [Simkania negevensis]CCB88703.1 tetracycline-efflux transporter [Simkania negevensis Z]